jgi:hypothetical protein
MRKLGVIEQKLLGSMLLLANDEGKLTANNTVLARKMGYKTSGGSITYAIKMLEINNYITKTNEGEYKVLI